MNRFDSAQYRIEKVRRSDDGENPVQGCQSCLFSVILIVKGIIPQTDHRDNHADHRLFIIHSVFLNLLNLFSKAFKQGFAKPIFKFCLQKLYFLNFKCHVSLKLSYSTFTFKLQFCILFLPHFKFNSNLGIELEFRRHFQSYSKSRTILLHSIMKQQAICLTALNIELITAGY